jgi:tRNA/tmRNA/rRNA uracil-C5-methylase (TrmA/RlmC/RlmD family)
MSIEAQRAWKRSQVVELLHRIGRVKVQSEAPTTSNQESQSDSPTSAENEWTVNVRDVIGSEHAYGYRSKLSPHFDKPKPNQEFAIGA